jgi:hypothetical protein
MSLIIVPRVKETTSSTGIGDLALVGAVAQFSSFGSRMAVGDTCFYTIEGVSPEWECGLGTYSASNTLTRTTVTHSSNSDALVSLSAGVKSVWIDVNATDYKDIRNGVSSRGVTLDIANTPTLA